MATQFNKIYSYPFKIVNGRYKPEIPVRIENFFTGKYINVNALLDTGLETCVLPEFIALALGCILNEQSRKSRGVKGISGEEIETHVHGFKIHLLDPSGKEIVRTKEVACNVVKTLALGPILGTKRFNQHFSIEFNCLAGSIEMKW